MKNKYQELNYIELVSQHGGIRLAAKAVSLPYSTFYDRYTRQLAVSYNAKSITYRLDADSNEMRPLFIKSRTDGTQADIMSKLIDELNANPVKPTPVIKKTTKSESDDLVVYPFTDVHVGLRSWGVVTGQNWDIDIFRERYNSAIDTLMQKTPDSKNALVILNGDILHWDGHLSVTPTSQHVLDADSRTTHMIAVARDYFVRVIEKALKKHDLITVNVVNGNHDKILSYMLGLIAKAYFSANERVKVNIIEAPMAHVLHGKSLIMNTHGDIVKYKQAPAYAASRIPSFADASYRCIFMGHLHKFQTEDFGGCEVIQLSTLTQDDSHGIGFQKSGKWLSAYTFAFEGGLTGYFRAY